MIYKSFSKLNLISIFILFFSSYSFAITLPFQSKKQVLFKQACKDPSSHSVSTNLIVEKLLSLVRLNDCSLAWKKIKNIKEIDLSELNISDITILKDFSNLKIVHLDDNYIEDLSALEHLKSLKELNVANNCLRSFDIVDKVNITLLDVENNLLEEAAIEKIKSKSSINTHYKYTDQQVWKEFCEEKKEAQKKNHIERIEQSNVAEQEQAQTPSAPSIDFIINGSLVNLKNLGIRFRNLKTLTDINKSSDLFDSISMLGLTHIDETSVLNYLNSLESLMKNTSTIKLGYPSNTFQEYQPGEESHKILKNFRTNFAALQIEGQRESYPKKLEDLKKNNLFDEYFYSRFYEKLTKDATLLESAVYPDSSQKNLMQKKSHLILLLAAIKRFNNGTRERRQIDSKSYASHSEPYPSDGQAQSWYQELQYKLFVIYNKYDSLSDAHKKNIISFLLHGSINCCDAKWNAITDAYKSCTSSTDEGRSLQEVSIESIIFDHLDHVKQDSLRKYITNFIDSNKKYHSESCTYFSRTWDHLSYEVGLEITGSPYSSHLIPEAIDSFPRKFSESIATKEIFKAVKQDLTDFLDRNHLGPMAQLLIDKDYLVIELLRYYLIIV